MPTIGVVGLGFVGGTLRDVLGRVCSIESYDTDPEKKSTCDSIEKLVERVDEIIFVCLPTPMGKDGRCVTSIVSETVESINRVCHHSRERRTVVIKSTVPPGTTDRLNEKYSHVDAVFNPEFLTEANAIDDFKHQTRIIIGGNSRQASVVKNFYTRAFPATPIIKTDAATAEMVKYFTNCFLAMKVTFANEMFQVCGAAGVDYDKVVEYTLFDDRIGKTHLTVPGPDGSMGFGGHCFPKDLNAMLFFAKRMGVDTKILMSVWQKNLDVRSPENRDWEKMKGRAVL